MNPDPIVLKLAACLVTLGVLVKLHLDQRRRNYADLYTPEIIRELKRQRRAHRQKGQHDPDNC